MLFEENDTYMLYCALKCNTSRDTIDGWRNKKGEAVMNVMIYECYEL